MFCPHCGSKIDPDGRFCPACGADVSGLSDRAQDAHVASRGRQAPNDSQGQQVRGDVVPQANDARTQLAQRVRRNSASGADGRGQHDQSSEATPWAPDDVEPSTQVRADSPNGPHYADATPAPVQDPPQVSRKKAALLPLVVALGVAAAVVLVLFLLLPGSGSGSGGGNGPASDSGSSNVSAGTNGAPAQVTDAATGKTVITLERPLLIALAEDGGAPVFTPAVQAYSVASDLSNVSNLADMYLSDDVKALLAEHGFAVDARWGNEEFYEVYEDNRYNYLPSFVTVDSLMHTYHLYFQHLQKNTERDHLAATIQGMGEELLAASEEQLEQLKGTEWESAARRNVTFFAVGASLQNDAVAVPAEVAADVEQELALITDAQNMTESVITGEPEDYTQYKPRGYYEGDEVLERYFRTMMWYGRCNFKQADEDLDRSALLMTLALTGDALDRWSATYAVTGFFAGASDDSGYYEYRPIIDAAYGENATVADLAGDDAAWGHFHELTKNMPAPQINSVAHYAADDDRTLDEDKGFRLMGQRFTLDEMIFERLTDPEVGKDAAGAGRTLPDALDVPAALGSDEALSILEAQGATGYANYDATIRSLRDELADETDTRWSASLYSQWLYTLNPLLRQKGEGYPSFMQTSAWARKNLQSYLGSFTELKHDTVLYAKQLMVEMGGGGIDELDDRGYVEPEPEVFGRLANLTGSTSTGLDNYGLLGDEDRNNLELLRELADRLSDIALKELTGEAVTDDDYELIRTYGGQLEHFWQEVYKYEATDEYFSSRDFPAAVVVDVATDGYNGSVLELGTGRASFIYAVVPVEGTLRVARGSVFSFYEFEQPMSDRLTDTSWREMMGIEMSGNGYVSEPAQDLEPWTDDFTVSSYNY